MRPVSGDQDMIAAAKFALTFTFNAQTSRAREE
jgi:hypothetical protein